MPAPPSPSLVPRPKPGLWVRIGRKALETWKVKGIPVFIAGVSLACLLLFFGNNLFVRIGSGEAGVISRPFSGGTDSECIFGEGLSIVAPWNKMFIYDVRTQQVVDDFTALSSDGTLIRIEVSIRFSLAHPDLALLHRQIGPDYIAKIVKPEVQAQLRLVLGQYTAEQIYTSRGLIGQAARQGVLHQLRERFVLLEDLLLKSVTLPKAVADPIEDKTTGKAGIRQVSTLDKLWSGGVAKLSVKSQDLTSSARPMAVIWFQGIALKSVTYHLESTVTYHSGSYLKVPLPSRVALAS